MKPAKSRYTALFALCAGLFIHLSAFAQAPARINYQGHLTSAGQPVTTPVDITVRLYDQLSGGSLLFAETHANVPVTNGVFNLSIGSVQSLTVEMFDGPRFLSVQVAGDAEMTPRAALATSPYAFVAERANTALTATTATTATTAASATTANALSGAATIAGSQITGTVSSATVPGAQVAGPVSAAGVGTQNTFVGASAGNPTLTGSGNTASGVNALQSSTTGDGNTASGATALSSNTEGSYNTASGYAGMSNNTTGFANTATGAYALIFNTTGFANTSTGAYSLQTNSTGVANTAAGRGAMLSNTTGSANTASGFAALYDNTTGQYNIALGYDAGRNLTTGGYNIAIGNAGVAGEGNTIRIGDSNQTKAFIAGIRGVATGNANGLPVVADSAGQLGTVASLPGSLISGEVASAATATSVSGNVSGSQITGAVANATSAIAVSGPVAGSQITGTITSATIPASQVTGAGVSYTIPGTGGVSGGGYLSLLTPSGRAEFYITCSYGSPTDNSAAWFAGHPSVTPGSIYVTNQVDGSPVQAFADLGYNLGGQDHAVLPAWPWHGVFTANDGGTLTRWDVTVMRVEPNCIAVVYAYNGGSATIVHP